MSGSGEAAWTTPITMTYLPVNTAADGRLFSLDGRNGGREEAAGGRSRDRKVFLISLHKHNK